MKITTSRREPSTLSRCVNNGVLDENASGQAVQRWSRRGARLYCDLSQLHRLGSWIGAPQRPGGKRRRTFHRTTDTVEAAWRGIWTGLDVPLVQNPALIGGSAHPGGQ